MPYALSLYILLISGICHGQELTIYFDEKPENSGDVRGSIEKCLRNNGVEIQSIIIREGKRSGHSTASTSFALTFKGELDLESFKNSLKIEIIQAHHVELKQDTAP